MKVLNFETIWHSLSTDLIDVGMRSRSIRDWALRQGEKQLYQHALLDNLFTPCAIRDHYYMACRAINKSGACHLDEDAGKAIQDHDYRRRMLEYDKRIAELLDPIWEQEVMSYKLSSDERPQLSEVIETASGQKKIHLALQESSKKEE